MVDIVVGAPSWKKSWSLPLWFDSLRANVDPAKTGLTFVVPAQDHATREIIANLSDGFAWIEIQRDKFPFDDDMNYRAQAAAKNYLIAQAIKSRAKHFIMWDTDLLAPAGTVEEAIRDDKPLTGIWVWLNRSAPQKLRHYDEEKDEFRDVYWEPPMQTTGMRWIGSCKARHFPNAEWELRSHSTWKADVVLGFQVMKREVFTTTVYRPHPDGESVPFNWNLETRGVPRYIMGNKIGVHMPKPDPDEIQMDWDTAMTLAHQHPLASVWTQPRDPMDELLGLYPERQQ